MKVTYSRYQTPVANAGQTPVIAPQSAPHFAPGLSPDPPAVPGCYLGATGKYSFATSPIQLQLYNLVLQWQFVSSIVILLAIIYYTIYCFHARF